jgi:hypothetical protein
MNISIEIPNTIQSYCKEKGYNEDDTKRLFKEFLYNLFEESDMYDHLVTDFDLWITDLGKDILKED